MNKTVDIGDYAVSFGESIAVTYKGVDIHEALGQNEVIDNFVEFLVKKAMQCQVI